jgi:putative DNA methylase
MTDINQSETLTPLKVEDELPVKAVGIECLKEGNPETMSPHRYLQKWWARRPTAAARLAVLASVLPDDVSNDELLGFMKVGPRNADHLTGSISDYVIEKRSTQSNSSKKLSDHYGYDQPLKSTPRGAELDDIHRKIKSTWDGDLPTVFDPTAGGGTIPLEALRYGFPVRANELNPVAWLINKVILEFAPNVGSLETDVRRWAQKIDEQVKEELSEYYPCEVSGYEPTYYFRAYSVGCPSCGYRLPLSNRWWFKKDSSSTGHAMKPIPHEDYIEYEYLHIEGSSDYDFNPSEGTVQSGDAECPTCGVVTESDDIKSLFQDGEFEFELCGVKETKKSGSDSLYRAPTEPDRVALEKVEEKIESSITLSTLLTTKIPDGKETTRTGFHGIDRWRDLFTPRQLLAHGTYLQEFEEIKPEIKSEYDDGKAEAILSLLTLIPGKLVSRTSRLCPINLPYGAPENMMGANNYSFKWQFGENNPTVGNYSYERMLESRRGVLASYEHVVDFVADIENPDVKLYQEDARKVELDDSVESVVIDPPYGDNVLYSELSDVFYVWHRLYLQDIYPGVYRQPLTEKDAEAVENISRFSESDVETNDSISSRREIARKDYEDKMSDIFSNIFDSLAESGVVTVYFTDKETEAWDSLTMSLINSGFTVTATHTITSEVPDRVGMQGNASADSTLLLTCRKPSEVDIGTSRPPSLWSDIREDTRKAAQEKATELLDSEHNLTKTDTIIGAFGPTLRVFTENYPVVDKHDEPVRPKRALEEARTAVVEVLVERELEDSLNNVDSLSKWYLLSWLVYERNSIPYDDARQLGLGVGVNVDEVKRDTKIWGKSGDTLLLKGESYRVQDHTALESGEKRRKRAYSIDPRDDSFDHNIDAVHASLNVIDTKGSDFTWNWLNDRGLHEQPAFRSVVKSLIQVLPENHEDWDKLVNLVSGETGKLLDIDVKSFYSGGTDSDANRMTLEDF